MADGCESAVEKIVFRLEACDAVWTVVVLAATSVGFRFLPKIVVRFSRAAKSTPHRSGVQEKASLHPPMRLRLQSEMSLNDTLKLNCEYLNQS